MVAGGSGRPDCLALFLVGKINELSAEERFERAFNANPAPALFCWLSDLRYTKATQDFLKMTGCTLDAVVGRSAYDLDAFENAPDKASVWKRCAQAVPSRRPRPL